MHVHNTYIHIYKKIKKDGEKEEEKNLLVEIHFV